MNLEIDGTKKILLVEDGQGLNLVTESTQAIVSIAGAVQPIRGDKGDTGVPGPANTIAIGTVTGGTSAAATITGTAPNQILNLTLPKGDTGSTGVIGAIAPLEYNQGIITLDTTGLGTTAINGLQGTRYAGVWTDTGTPGESTGPWQKGDLLLGVDGSNSGASLIVNKDGTSSNWLIIGPVATNSEASSSLTPSTTNNVGTSAHVAHHDHTHALDLSTATTSGLNIGTSAANKIISASTSSSGNPISTSNKVIDELSGATSSSKGIIQLTGDLAGTATAPIIKPSNNVDFNQKQLNNLPTTSYPNNAGDAATKAYVDQQAVGLAKKDAVQAATTGNIGTFPPTGTQTIDGITVTTTSGPNGTPARVLVKDQSTASQNGIWVVNSGAWTRATDLDVWAEAANAYVLVLAGNVNAATSWVADVPPGSSGTIDSTAINFKQFTASITLTAGNGISVSGQTITARADTSSNASIVVNSGSSPNGIAVKFNSSEGLTTTSNGLAVSGIKTSMIDSSLILPTINGGLGVNVSTNQSGARFALGLGNSAVLNTGAASGTVATGNHSHTFRTTQSFAIQGNIVTGSDLGVPIFFATTGFVPPSGQTSQTQLIKVMYKIGGGAGASPSATFDIRNASFATVTSPSTWTGITGFTGLVAVNTENRVVTPTPVTITDTDQIALWVSGINGTPQNLSVTLVFAHTLNP